ncbi:MAG TPA: VTT domain-containing protein [Phycisphaerales bacterium]|nr:VTT domain-containing protein [Phycisphaerales bacterium]
MQAPAPAPRPTVLRRLGPASILAACATFLPPLGSLLLFATMGSTGPWLRAQGSAGLAIYAAGFALLAGLALLPTYAQSALGGFAFGVTLGLPAALAGFVGGAFIGYEIARRASGDRVMALVAEHPRLLALREALLGDDATGPPSLFRTLALVALIRVPPNSPFALTNLVLASVKTPRAPFLLGTLLGMTPRTAAAVVIGSGARHLTRDELESSLLARTGLDKWALAAIGLAITLLVLGLIALIANRALARVTARTTRQPSVGKAI